MKKIATIINAHENDLLTLDTIHAVKTFVGNDIILLSDGAAWNWAENLDTDVHKLCGLVHNHCKSPYKNIVLALKYAYKIFPDAEWYCYLEQDVLFTSRYFLDCLDDSWCIGNNLRKIYHELPLLNYIIGDEIKEGRYLLGCCVFFNSLFIKKLNSIDFFNKFLILTNTFNKDFFPGYNEYDIAEYLFPTLANHFGGKVTQLAGWSDLLCSWNGDFQHFPMRWKPELENLNEHIDASIIHPVKDVYHPIRQFFRDKRNRCLVQKL